MGNHQPQMPGGGMFIPPGAVDPQKMLAAQIRNMRINIAGETMARLVAAEVTVQTPRPPDCLAQHAVACADALLRELSKGIFGLPIKWEDEDKEIDPCSDG